MEKADEKEVEVADILVNLNDLILKRTRSWVEFDFTPFLPKPWGNKRRRSVYEPNTQSLPIPSPGKVNAEVPSPSSPLLYPPPRSSDKPNICHPCQSKNKKRDNLVQKRDDLVQNIEELSQSKDLLRREVERVKAYYNELLARNTQLKSLRQQVLFSSRAPQDRVEPRVKKPESCSSGPHLSSSNLIGLPNQQMLLDHPTVMVDSQTKEPPHFVHSQVSSQQHFLSGYRSGCVNYDLNIPACIDPTQTSDYLLARRAQYAQARRERKEKKASRKNKSIYTDLKVSRS